MATGEVFAVKIMPNVREDIRELWQKEVKCLRMAASPHVVSIVDAFEEEKAFFIVMELCDSDFFSSLERHIPDEDEARLFFVQLLVAVEHIHKMGIIHRDLKPENLLLSQKKQFSFDNMRGPSLVLADFGSAACDLRRSGGHLRQEKSTKLGTPTYLAPEILDPTVHAFSQAADVWACGVILYLTIVGEFPFVQADTSCPDFRAYLRDCYEFLPNHLSPELRELLASLLSVDPATRVSIRDALASPWFGGLAPQLSEESTSSSPDLWSSLPQPMSPVMAVPSPTEGTPVSQSKSRAMPTSPAGSPSPQHSTLPTAMSLASRTPPNSCSSQASDSLWRLEVALVPLQSTS
jgi:serine/threonine protein kinase